MGRRFKQIFLQEGIQMAKTHMKRCSTRLTHERNASQNYNEVSHHIAYKGHHQKMYTK